MLIQCEDRKVYELLYRDEFSCKVYNDLTLRLGGEVWQLDYCEPFYQMIGKRVTVFKHPLEQDQIYVEWEGREYQVSRREFDPGLGLKGLSIYRKVSVSVRLRQWETVISAT